VTIVDLTGLVIDDSPNTPSAVRGWSLYSAK